MMTAMAAVVTRILRTSIHSMLPHYRLHRAAVGRVTLTAAPLTLTHALSLREVDGSDACPLGTARRKAGPDALLGQKRKANISTSSHHFNITNGPGLRSKLTPSCGVRLFGQPGLIHELDKILGESVGPRWAVAMNNNAPFAIPATLDERRDLMLNLGAISVVPCTSDEDSQQSPSGPQKSCDCCCDSDPEEES